MYQNDSYENDGVRTYEMTTLATGVKAKLIPETGTMYSQESLVTADDSQDDAGKSFMHSKFGMTWQIAVAIFIIFVVSLTSLLMALSTKTDVRNCKCFTETGPAGRCKLI